MSGRGNSVAVLILCHGAPAGLSGLGRFFEGHGFDLFVHVDAKVDEAPFRAAAPEARFVAPRIGVFWRGFTMVEATIALIKAARARQAYARYVLISDDTVPLQPLAAIREALLGNEEFIATRPAEDFRHRYDSFFLFDSQATQLRWIPLPERQVTPDLIARAKRLEMLMTQGKKKLSVFWYGSQWMALTAATIEMVLARWESDGWLRESFEFSDTPDESYIQTIIGEHMGAIDRAPVYVDWNAPKPPRLFTDIGELEGVRQPRFMFARKVKLPEEQLHQWVDRLRR